MKPLRGVLALSTLLSVPAAPILAAIMTYRAGCAWWPVFILLLVGQLWWGYPSVARGAREAIAEDRQAKLRGL